MTESEVCEALKRAVCESGVCDRLRVLEDKVKRLEARAVPARKPENYEDVKEEFGRKGGGFGQAEKFWNHYQMVGWVTGKTHAPLKDWRAAVSQWIVRDGGAIMNKEVKSKPKEGKDFYLRDRGDGVFSQFKMSNGERTGEPFVREEWEG